ncbi:MAG: class I SAM-dependent methyltransferase [Puniceicoccaceae bacterium]
MSGLEKQHKKEWFDNDAFWEGLYPYMFTEERFERTSEELEKVLELTKPEGKDVLDLCCGPGRYSVAMAKAGFNVTGVDRTQFLLDKARERAAEADVEIDWIQMDMRDFFRPDSFDLVLNMFTSFGYFDDKDEDLQVLGNIFTSLRPGGVVIIEMVGKEWLAKVFQPTISTSEADGSRLVQVHEVIDDWSRIRNEWILIKDGQTQTFKFHHTIYSGQEIKDRMKQVGFDDITLYGNFDGDEYGYNASRLIVVARRPSE